VKDGVISRNSETITKKGELSAMKKFYPAIAAIFLLTMSAISTFAQTQTPTVSIAFIDTGAFYDEKAGIIRLINANKRLESDFTGRLKELQDGSTKLQ